MQTIKFIFFWRLVKEKWFDLIIDVLNYFRNNSNIKFYIFWKWDFEYDLVAWEYNNVEFFWRKSKDFINEYLEDSHFALMPSMFLETFWLSAVESLSMWVPVIWFSKWGLTPFIHKDLDIFRQPWNTNSEKLINLINILIGSFNSQKYDEYSLWSRWVSKHYLVENWIDKFQNLPGSSKKVLLVSDYLPRIWWIEDYINNVKEILTSNWYEVEMLWWNWINWKVSGLLRKLLLPITWFNLLYYFFLKRKINQFKPDVVRLHSVSRFLGWLPISALKGFKWSKWIMYHDLWYFHPYPSKVYDNESVSYKFNLSNFLAAANWVSILKKISVLLKFIWNSIIRKLLINNIDLHIIPSEFMKDILENNYWVEKKKVVVLEHFIK